MFSPVQGNRQFVRGKDAESTAFEQKRQSFGPCEADGKTVPPNGHAVIVRSQGVIHAESCGLIRRGGWDRY
jgi:hypothetical protein